LAGLHQRSPFLAAVMALAMVSLAGIPPLAGFMGKFLLLKAVIEQGPVTAGYYGLAFVALAGVVISLYYYFGVVRAVYWPQAAASNEAITLSGTIRVALGVCVAGMLWLGLFPGGVLRWAESAVLVLK